MVNYENEHRKLWNWLADHPEAKKADYFKNWNYIPHNECFACEAALQAARRVSSYHTCRFCPLGGESVVGCDGGLYSNWWAADSRERRQQLALQIANLPWKEINHEADQL